MSSVKRNLWIMITLSALFLIAEKWISNANQGNHQAHHAQYLNFDKQVEATEVVNPAIDEFMVTTVKPEAINLEDVRRRIGYPAEAVLKGIEGDVKVRILVDEQGNYVEHRIIKVGHAILAEATENEIHKIGFIPGIKDGRPVRCWVNVTVPFQLSR